MTTTAVKTELDVLDLRAIEARLEEDFAILPTPKIVKTGDGYAVMCRRGHQSPLPSFSLPDDPCRVCISERIPARHRGYRAGYENGYLGAIAAHRTGRKGPGMLEGYGRNGHNAALLAGWQAGEKAFATAVNAC